MAPIPSLIPARTISLFVVDFERAQAGQDAPAPRGRVAALRLGETDPRSLLEAWVEDLSVAAVYDAPTEVIAELGAALELPPLADQADEHAPLVWTREKPSFELPAGALASVEASLRVDLLEAVRALFEALRPGLAVVAVRV